MGVPASLGVAASGVSPLVGDDANAVLQGRVTAVGPGRGIAITGPLNVLIWASSTTALTTTNGSVAASVVSGTGIAVGTSINSVNVPPGTTWATFAGTSGTLAIPSITLSGQFSAGSNIISGLASTNGLLGATVVAAGTTADFSGGTTVTAILVPSIAATLNAPAQLGSVQISSAALTSTATPNPRQIIFGLTSNVIVSGTDAAASFTGAGIVYVGSIQVERSFDGGLTWIICNVGGSGTLAVYSGGGPISLTFGEPERNVMYRVNCTSYTSGIINFRISTSGSAATSLVLASQI